MLLIPREIGLGEEIVNRIGCASGNGILPLDEGRKSKKGAEFLIRSYAYQGVYDQVIGILCLYLFPRLPLKTGKVLGSDALAKGSDRTAPEIVIACTQTFFLAQSNLSHALLFHAEVPNEILLNPPKEDGVIAALRRHLIKGIIDELFGLIECQVAPQLTVVSDVMSDVTSKARRIFNKLQAQHPQ
jgi:hypothetical protein